MYVRQHYKLATTGKLGQKLEGGMGGKRGKSSTDMKRKTVSRIGFSGPSGTVGLGGIKVGGGTPA